MFDTGSRLAAGVLGFDIGGANIKAATDSGQSDSIFFPMWQRPHDLAESLVAIARTFGPSDCWAVTMTGEMADAFFDRQIGVKHIAKQAVVAAAEVGCNDVVFYSVAGRFLTIDEVLADPDQVASANWHALANWVAQEIDSPALLIDIGSTTTDIIPISPAIVSTPSQTDFDRLVASELVYIGGGRTPVCALVSQLPFRGKNVPVMREVFATTDDCALVLGWCNESPEDRMTSDGGPRTIAAAINRLARMIGLDHRGITLNDAHAIASSVVDSASAIITAAIASQPLSHRNRWILSGHTAEYFLSASLARSSSIRIERLADRLGPELSRVGPALACAKLLVKSRQQLQTAGAAR
ncbi:MAG TPA: tetrahydromethanopterin-linked C1 transfer pathway [Planctomycetaceae bacterium]|nr:tetrahydromethanopterin-linked C1 transfer pathway [Planctomycetaceae bacterium]